MNKINAVDNEIYIFGDFSINLFLNDLFFQLVFSTCF